MNNKNTINKNGVSLKRLEKIANLFGDLFYHGWNRIKKNKLKYLGIILMFALVVFNLTYNYDLFVIMHKLYPPIFSTWFLSLCVKIPWLYYFLGIFLPGLIVSFPLSGLNEFLRLKKYQGPFDLLSMKAGNGQRPKVIKAIEIDENKTKVILKSEGIGVERYKNKIDDLTSAFGQIIESIESCKNPKFIEVSLTKKRLPEKVSYYELEKEKKKPYSFMIGESLGGNLDQDISSLPHMLIAGTTGGGKSVFFKQTLLSLLKSSNHLQLYLLDLKKGVEMRAFSDLPNVKVIKDEKDAVVTLRNLKKEMDDRFKFLEKNKINEIIPTRDNMDKIIIGIDEASILYTKSKNATKNKYITEARELTDELSKLSRAAGIHLIFATQKVTKETIDTKVQENIGGRMCFKMNTLQGSMTVLGNKKALELPDIKGRAIWAKGSEFTEVQAPFLSEEELEEELSSLSNEFESKERKFFGPMISPENIAMENQVDIQDESNVKKNAS